MFRLFILPFILLIGLMCSAQRYIYNLTLSWRACFAHTFKYSVEVDPGIDELT